jgi:hypothetical protein
MNYVTVGDVAPRPQASPSAYCFSSRPLSIIPSSLKHYTRQFGVLVSLIRLTGDLPVYVTLSVLVLTAKVKCTRPYLVNLVWGIELPLITFLLSYLAMEVYML